jgi:phenylalanyl-tRNA synthetase alpha chain
MSGLESLSQKNFVTIERQVKKRLELTAEGTTYASAGLPEVRLAKAVRKPLEMSAAIAAAGLSEQESRIALQWAMRNKLLVTEKKDNKTLLAPVAKEIESGEQELLQALVRGKRIAGAAEEKLLATLVQRGLVKESEEKSVFAKITAKGAKAAAEEAGKVSQLTPQMLKTGEWKGKRFREYDLATVAAPMLIARKHVYKEFLNRIKLNLVGLGFKEMHGPLVELEFWNMDALFMPQDHPAREVHDIFSVKRGYAPAEVTDAKTLAKVQEAHERGLDGSMGWRYSWNPATAAQLVLRSHTTAVSARHLAKGLPSPSKLFCIGRVFRPDEIDWKHFIEFNQCDGIVLDESINFRELLGYLKAFAQEVFGAQKVRFNPTYFPFTEPSVELSVEIPGRGWAEVGGAGMFRPEMLRALGVEQPVIAWGLGIDRLAMLSLGITDIRELNSHKLDFLRSR